MSDNQSYKIKIKPSQMILFGLSIVALYIFAPQLIDFQTTVRLLWNSNWLWLMVAVAAMAFCFWAAAYVQYAAGDSIGKVDDFLQLQLAGSLLNHFLPYSLGVIGLVTQYYRKHDQKRSRAIIMATIPLAVGTVVVTLMTLIISPLTFFEIANNISVKSRPELIFIIVDIIAIIALIASYYFWDKLVEAIKEALIGLKSLRSIRQIVRVSGGSAVQALSASLVLYASVQAIHGHLGFITCTTIFIGSMLVSEITPTPGGIGATEAVLVLGMTGAGLSASEAVSATLIFRFITFLLPLIPGAFAVGKLNRLTTSKTI